MGAAFRLRAHLREDLEVKTSSKVIVGVVAAAAVAGGAWVLLGKGESREVPYLTAELDRGAIVQTVTTAGTLTAVTTVKVGSQVSGIIATLHADFNEAVTKSQVLATLDPTPFEAQVAQTRAQLQRTRVAALDAQAKLKRQQALFQAELASEDQLDSAKAVFDQAQAQVAELEASLERAETNLQYSVIRSPIDGVVVSRDYDVGQTVAASFQAPTLFTIAEDLARMQLTCDVDEADIGQVKNGQPVRFSVDTFPERQFTGAVAQIRLSPKVANNVVTYPVIVSVSNEDLKLLPGMTAEVRIEVARAEAAVRVPAAALRFRPEMIGMGGRPGQQTGGGMGAQGGGGRPSMGGQQGGQGGQGDAPRAARDEARVFLAPAKPGDPLTPVTFVTGLTDGQFFEVKRGDLAEGTKIVVGLATSQSQQAGGLAGMTPFGGRR
jgi:HlyD family secretion protein